MKSSGRRSVAGIAFENGKIFAARRREGGDLGSKWEFPGGKARDGESGEQALEREFAEELSVAVRVGARVGETEFVHGGTRFILTAYLIEFLGKDFSFGEHSEYRWFFPEELETLDFAPSDSALFPAVFESLRGPKGNGAVV
jgi:8-oxo-dGTP diphosphatase